MNFLIKCPKCRSKLNILVEINSCTDYYYEGECSCGNKDFEVEIGRKVGEYFGSYTEYLRDCKENR